MFSRIVVSICILAVLSSPVFAMSVPSVSPVQEQNDNTVIRGGESFTETELILIIVGAVLGTVVLLSIIN